MRKLLLVAEVLSPYSVCSDRFLQGLRYREAAMPR